jgi:hypothetical protein
MTSEICRMGSKDHDKVLSLHAERYVVTVKKSKIRHKLLQVIFSKKDGSLFVNFPYFMHSKGLVSLVTIRRNVLPPMNVSLKPGGRVTSHRVKYSHHLDGKAHFSQTGLARSLVRKRSVPLTSAEGHLFTVKMHGIGDFEPVDHQKEKQPASEKRTAINFEAGRVESEAVKIVGRWYSQKALLRRTIVSKYPGKVSGPYVTGITPEGKVYQVALLGPPIGTPTDEYILMLTCEGIPRENTSLKSTLFFIGGFDHETIVDDLRRETTFLVLSYPVDNYEELAQELGTIDLET